MNLRHLLPGLLFLVGCASANKKTQEKDQLSELTAHASYPIAFETAPPTAQSFAQLSKAKRSNQRKVTKKETTKTTDYIGMKGYLIRPAMFTGKNYEVAYQRCAQIEITGVYQSEKTIYVYIKQNGYTFPLVGVNRKDFVRTAKGRIPLLDQFFVKELGFVNANRQVASDAQKVCSGQTWKNMPKEQFLFVTGDPEYRKPVHHYDVLTYAGADQSAPRHYYFLSNKLYSWTQ